MLGLEGTFDRVKDLTESESSVNFRSPKMESHSLILVVAWSELNIRCERRRIHLCREVSLLRFSSRNLLVELLGDFDEATAIDLTVPLQLTKLSSKLPEEQ